MKDTLIADWSNDQLRVVLWCSSDSGDGAAQKSPQAHGPDGGGNYIAGTISERHSDGFSVVGGH